MRPSVRLGHYAESPSSLLVLSELTTLERLQASSTQFMDAVGMGQLLRRRPLTSWPSMCCGLDGGNASCAGSTLAMIRHLIRVGDPWASWRSGGRSTPVLHVQRNCSNIRLGRTSVLWRVFGGSALVHISESYAIRLPPLTKNSSNHRLHSSLIKAKGGFVKEPKAWPATYLVARYL